MSYSIIHTSFDFDTLPLFRRGKVRDIFDFGEHLLVVSSDRISAFDSVLPEGIPGKGAVLTRISEYWFNQLGVAHHCVSTNMADFPEETQMYHSVLSGRSMLVKKATLIPIECVVRGYIIGSGWKDYQRTGAICGHVLPPNLELAQALEAPIFTPASKSFEGHDENISIDTMRDQIGSDLTDTLMNLSLSIYSKAAEHAKQRGIIIADTKFEFGLLDDQVILIDEVLTPDSSRFWPRDLYRVGESPPSFDKQIVRDYIESTGWQSPSALPPLPTAIIEKTAREYQAIADCLTQSH